MPTAPDQIQFTPDIPHAPPVNPAKLDGGRKRYGKDFLRAERWFVGKDADGKPQYVPFSTADLKGMAERFAEHASVGVDHPLVWDHRLDNGQGDSSERDSIQDIGEIWLHEDTLWFTVYATEDQAKLLTEKKRQCSPFIVWNWVDGTGREWPGPSILNIGCVAHATVPNQKPFVAMGVGGPSSPPVEKKKMPLTFEVAKEALNRLADKIRPGAALPEGISEDNADEMVPMFVEMLCGPAEDTAAPDAPTLDAPPEGGDLMMSLKQYFDSRLAPLQASVEGLVGQKVATAKEAFTARVDALCKGGVLAKHRPKMLAMGVATNFDVSFLDVYGDADKVATGSAIGVAVDGKESGTGLSDADMADARKRMGLKPKS